MKLGFLSFASMGLAIAVVLLSWAYFYKYQPDMETANNWATLATQLKTNADQLPKAKKRKQQAIQMVQDAATKWQQVVATRTPPDNLKTGGIDMGVNAWQMVIDVRQYRNSIQKALNKQLVQGGVKVINGPAIPMPSENPADVVATFFNYPAIPYPVVIFDLGQVTVEGTYPQIKANMAAWSHMPNYLAVADGLTLTGTAPVLTGTYSVSMVGFIKAKVIYPSVQMAGAAPAAPGGGGGPARGGAGGPPPGTNIGGPRAGGKGGG